MKDVEFKDVFSKIEGELIIAYEAYIKDEKGNRWHYAHNRGPTQSIEGFKQDVLDSFEVYGYDDFRRVE